jgi:energy-coupling factor transport system permease protein
MSTFSMGRYVPYNSFVHRMDPRAKIFGLIALMVAIFMDFGYSWTLTFTMDGIAFVLILVLLWSTHTSFRQVLNSLKSLWFMAIFLLIIYILMPTGTSDWLAFKIGTYPIYWDSILNAAKILLRLILMIELTMVLTSSTKPLDLTYAFEWYLYPLKLIGFPSHEVAMTLSIALRFIPTILEDVERIMKAQSSRGVDFAHGKIGAKFRAVVSLIVPSICFFFHPKRGTRQRDGVPRLRPESQTDPIPAIEVLLVGPVGDGLCLCGSCHLHLRRRHEVRSF